MIKIEEAFKNKKAFIPFVLAGYPNLEATEKFILKMAEAGADLIEIGIPFSDPVAEGTVIQAASKVALSGNMTTNDIFDMAEKLKGKVNIPLVFMTYINPIFVYGKDKFFARCKQCNISGVIVADLPFEEILWGYFTLQDAVDFARYAVETTIQTMHFKNVIETVGGAVDILVITPDETKWLQKEYLK